MEKEEIKSLLEKDTKALEVNDIKPELLKDIDEIILEKISEISQEVFSVYKKFVTMKQEAPNGMKNELFLAIGNYKKERFDSKAFIDALFLTRFLMVKSEISAHCYYETAQILSQLGYADLGQEFVGIYEQKETNKPLKYLTLANFYNLELKDYRTAITYYEQYLKIDETKSVVYTILASLYSKAYGDIGLKDQIYYFERAYKLKPTDRLTLHGLAFAYERLGDKKMSDKYYRELLENNPTETDFYNYGGFLISCGDLFNGHKYFTHRFSTGDINLKYPIADESKKWNFKSDISNKTLLVHYEQGFGDTFMYCRYVPFLKNLAKKIIFIVQDNLYELIKSSKLISNEIEVLSESEFSKNDVEYDYHMALLDAPYVLANDEIPYTQGYLTVDEDLVKKYAKKHLKKTSKIKVGIAYHGDKSANYNGRDIDECKFLSLMNIKDVEFYSLQVESEVRIDEVKDLGATFKDFTDTACAIKNMDVVISTDNVILNLAGALGVKTFGLFNLYTNYRWFKLEGENVGWYDSVKPFQVEENNRWSVVFSKLHNELEALCHDKVGV